MSRTFTKTKFVIFCTLIWACASTATIHAQIAADHLERTSIGESGDQLPADYELTSYMDIADFNALDAVLQFKVRDALSQAKNDPRSFMMRTAPCWAPNTPESVVELFHGLYYQIQQRIVTDYPAYRYFIGATWSATATDGIGIQQGDPLTITWSYVPDGTTIESNSADPNGTSDLIAFLNGITGPPSTPGDLSTAIWHQAFVQAFATWSAVSGATFVYEPNDDGATTATFNQGATGVRGDVRIAGDLIDGDFNTLAFNYFPDLGDMVIDTDDSFYANNYNPATQTFSNAFINVLAHELGHGLGFNHNCPIDQVKLMEPFVSGAFLGPQEDDILAINRNYGDRLGNNDLPANATNAGAIALGSPYQITGLSVDGADDEDLFLFTIADDSEVTATMTPTGTTYLNGPQNTNGTCSAGTNFNAQAITDLQVEILNTNGSTVLGIGNTTGEGVAETVSQNLTAGTYYVRVQQQVNENDVQIYNLDIAVSALLPVELLTFTARPVGNAVQLDWATAAELNNDYFDLERSADGKSFAAVGRVGGMGTVSVQTDYNFDDRTPLGGTSYYRLAQYDYDGTRTYSEVVSVTRAAQAGWQVSPNPVATDAIEVRYAAEGRADIRLFDVNGRIVRSWSFDNGDGEQVMHTLELTELARGVYTLSLQQGVQNLTERIVRL